MDYNINHFEEVFKKIPEDRFCEDTEDKDGRRCYMGHLVGREYEQVSLAKLLHENLHLSAGDLVYGHDERYQQPSLKKRILAALTDIKAAQAVEQAEEIITNHKTLEHELQY